MDLPQPQHPLVSVVKFEDIKTKRDVERPKSIMNGFYSIALKKTFNSKMKYGQQSYDFTEGILAFIAPNQIISILIDESQSIEHSGWLLIFHPDFLWNMTLSQKVCKLKS